MKKRTTRNILMWWLQYKSAKNRWKNELQEIYLCGDFNINLLKIDEKTNYKKYTCGDFNINLLKIDEKTTYKKFYELMSSYGLLPQILNPTREIGN